MRLRVGHQHWWFLSILTRFVDYYSPFWGPKAISTVVEPQGALTCRSSTIVVLADSGPFLGLLLSYGVPERFPQLRNTGVRLRVGHEHSQIWPILVRFVHYYSPFWGRRAIFTIDDPRGVFTCPSSTLTVLPILTRFVDSYSPFWGPEMISIVVEPQGALTCRS